MGILGHLKQKDYLFGGLFFQLFKLGQKGQTYNILLHMRKTGCEEKLLLRSVKIEAP